MTSSTATLPEQTAATAESAGPPPSKTWQRPLGWALLAAGAALAWMGSWPALLGLALAIAGVLLAAQPAQVTSGNAPEAAAEQAVPVGGRFGAEVMVSEVVPVWSRQMEVTRDQATDGLANILNVFSQMSEALHTLTVNLASFQVSAEPGAVHQAVRTESPALDALCAASQRAFDERNVAVAELSRCAEALLELQQLAKQIREIARHTRLVAFNASIEANRSRTVNEGGSQAVAMELRTLATRMSETGARVEQVVLALQTSIRKARRDGEVGDTTPEELRQEIDIQARQALTALLGAVGASLQGSVSVREASQTLRDQLDEVFVHFQFGDRVSQMMSIVANDMSNFSRWVTRNPRATQSDAAEWLTALEASYTMEEQRSSHHGNVHVEKSSGVEFF